MTEPVTNSNGSAASNGNGQPTATPDQRSREDQRPGPQDHRPEGRTPGRRSPDRAGGEAPHRAARPDAPGQRPGEGTEAAPPPEPGDPEHAGQHPPAQGFGGLAALPPRLCGPAPRSLEQCFSCLLSYPSYKAAGRRRLVRPARLPVAFPRPCKVPGAIPGPLALLAVPYATAAVAAS